MTDIDKYRKGYEDMKDKIEESRHDKVEDIPEAFVKGVVRLPLTVIEELTRNRDEDRGRDDALNGRDFNPGRTDEDRSKCFITTACLRSRGITDDNCYELRHLRWLRDHYMLRSQEGEQLVESYYRLAPSLVDAISSSKESDTAYRVIYEDLVLPAVQLIEAGQYGKAVSLYISRVEKLSAAYRMSKP